MTDVTKVEATGEGRPDLPSETLPPDQMTAPDPSLAAPRYPHGWKGCVTTTRAGNVCMMPALAGTSRCWSHTPGLAQESGRQGAHPGRRRQKRALVDPEAPIATMPDQPCDTPEQIAQLRTLAINAVRRGEMDPNVGASLSRMLADQSRALEAV